MDNIIKKTKVNNDICFDDSFGLAQHCAMLLSYTDKEKQTEARRIIIRVLDKWQFIDNNTKSIWADLIESVGFYPYVQKNSLSLSSLSDNIRKEFYSSKYINNYFHAEQKKLSDLIFSGKNVIASAPTSFGKSLLIEEIVASGLYKNIIIIQPTLALLDQTRIILKKYNEKYKIIVRTTQPPSFEKGNLFLLTAERVMEYDNLPHIEYLIIDEFYKLSSNRADDRKNTLNNAFLKIMNVHKSKFYFLGPNIDSISPGFAKRYNAEFFKSDFSLVDCNVINVFDSETSEKTKLEVLFKLLDSFEEQALIYCSGPARARRFAIKYVDHLITKGSDQSNEYIPLTEWIEKSISNKWRLYDCLKYGITFHDGSLQKHIGSSVIEYFNNRKLKYIFCTSTIIEGVNTSAKNVVLFDNKRGDKDIDFFDYSNIKGRSGRLMEHYIGNIYNFCPIPKEEKITIDIPFFDQNPIDDEVLINIPYEDVKENKKEQHNRLHKMDPELLNIIKRNGVSVDGQLNIYKVLERDLYNFNYNYINWSRLPNYDQLKYLLRLGVGNLFEFNKKSYVASAEQLCYFLFEYMKKKDIMALVRIFFKNARDNVKKLTPARQINYFNHAIEKAFNVYRHWFQFRIPKAISVIDSLQKHICMLNGRKAGSYVYFIQQLENDFIQENLSILLEYGVPTSAIRKLEQYIPNDLNEDEVLQYLRNNQEILFGKFLQYERDKLLHCI